MTTIKLVETDKELLGILSLLRKNLKESVVENERHTDGFVTVEYDFNLLKRMNSIEKQVIAVDEGSVIGYALVLTKELINNIEVLKPMLNTIESLSYNSNKLYNLKYYIMGQICIHKDYRGKGFFKELYNKQFEELSSKYHLCLTEVSSSNMRSLKAHLNHGFQIVKTFTDGTDTWHIILKNLK